MTANDKGYGPQDSVGPVKGQTILANGWMLRLEKLQEVRQGVDLSSVCQLPMGEEPRKDAAGDHQKRLPQRQGRVHHRLRGLVGVQRHKRCAAAHHFAVAVRHRILCSHEGIVDAREAPPEPGAMGAHQLGHARLPRRLARARWQAAAAAARIHGDAPQAAACQGEGQQTGATGHVQDGAGGQGTDRPSEKSPPRPQLFRSLHGFPPGHGAPPLETLEKAKPEALLGPCFED